MYQIKESDKTKALKAILKMKNQHETWNKTHIEKKFKKIKHKKENFSISPGGCWIKADKVQKAADRLKSFSLNNYHISQKKKSALLKAPPADIFLFCLSFLQPQWFSSGHATKLSQRSLLVAIASDRVHIRLSWRFSLALCFTPFWLSGLARRRLPHTTFTITMKSVYFVILSSI